jgi:multimeric flavodoxin WrbA
MARSTAAPIVPEKPASRAESATARDGQEVDMRATVINCSLKSSDTQSNTQLLADHVIDELEDKGVDVHTFRLADLRLPYGVETTIGDDDDWPKVHDAITASEILVVASPTWLGHPSSLAQLMLERMNAMMAETDETDRPIAYNRVAGVVVTGNEDGAHHVISEICGGLIDLGFTVPGQSWTYWNRGPGPGPQFTDTDEGHDWSLQTGTTMASNLYAVAHALQHHPVPAQ